jgi:anti-sigma factor RsiW
MGLFCWPTRHRLDAYQDGELDGTTRSRVERHLARCGACSAEVASLTRLHAALAAPGAGAGSDPPEAVWDAFWPQVRMRMATAPAPEAPRWRAWTMAPGGPRFVLGSALAAATLAVVAILAPWQGVERHVPAGTSGSGVQVASLAAPDMMVQSVETADPQSSVMVYTNPESDVTVVWVFGLERTGT